MVIRAKILGTGFWVKAKQFAFFVSREIARTCATPGRLATAMGTGQAIGAYTGAGGQCTDAIGTDVDADGPARILHTGTGSGGLGQAKSRTGLPT